MNIDLPNPSEGEFVPIPRETAVVPRNGPVPSAEVDSTHGSARRTFNAGDLVTSIERPGLGTVITSGESAALVEFINRTTGVTESAWLPFGALTVRKRAWKRQAVKVMSFAELMKLEPAKWHVQHLFHAQGLVVVYGPPGCGKSFLVLSIALAISTGTPWFGREVQRGPVLYIAAEGNRGLPPRIRAALQDSGLPEADLEHRFLTVGAAIQFLDPVDFESLRSAIAEMPVAPGLIIIDTLARCMAAGDENSARDMGAFVGACDLLRTDFRASVVIVHHSGKSEGAVERGSSALRGATDTTLAVTKVEGGLRLVCEKQKEAESFQPIEFTLQPVTVALHGEGEVTTSCKLVLREAAAVHSGATLKEAQAKILRTLAGPLMSGEASKSELLKATGISSTTFYREATTLTEKGYVESTGSRARSRLLLTPRGRDAVSQSSQGSPRENLGEPTDSPNHPTPLRGGIGREESGDVAEGADSAEVRHA